ncbi:MAG: PIN domain-containing protein [Candidatus Cryptobacteroides sp.]|nr:PIN domain-containing protein [Candidatus Cryptobacteroides sp.]
MKLFLDTNILLDLLLEREGYERCARLFQLQEEGKCTLAVSILTMVNVAYVYRKTVGQDMAVVNLKYLSTMLEVLPMDNEILQSSIFKHGKDIEDVLQAMCAATGGCDAIITRNEKDYVIRDGLVKTQITLPPVFTPTSFLLSIEK